jgi:glycosyltransferase involved in cell wall biosynthesis
MAVIGIIIPCHNSARFLPRTIRSVREQIFTDWKCVIVDDCSTDNSREVAKSSCDGDTRFSLLALAQTVRYVIFLDSDDVWNASSLRVLVNAIEENPSRVAVYGNCRAINQDGAYCATDEVETVGRERFDYRDGRLVLLMGTAETNFCQFLLRNPVVSPGCLLIRAEVIAKVTENSSKLFDPKTEFGEDLAAWLRIVRAGCVGHLDRTVLDYRLHCSNKSNRRWGVAISVRRVRLKALRDPTLEPHELLRACAAFRAYRKYRIGAEMKSALSCLHRRRFRDVLRLCVCAAVNALDIAMILALQVRPSLPVFRQRPVAVPEQNSQTTQPSATLSDRAAS